MEWNDWKDNTTTNKGLIYSLLPVIEHIALYTIDLTSSKGLNYLYSQG